MLFRSTVELITPVEVTGVQGIGQIGSTSVITGVDVYLTGVQATGIIGQVLVWGQIPDVPDPHWTSIDDSGSDGWTQINDNAVPNWDLIAA